MKAENKRKRNLTIVDIKVDEENENPAEIFCFFFVRKWQKTTTTTYVCSLVGKALNLSITNIKIM